MSNTTFTTALKPWRGFANLRSYPAELQRDLRELDQFLLELRQAVGTVHTSISVATGGSGTLPSTSKKVRHIVYVTNILGMPVTGVTDDKFTVTIESDDDALSAGTETVTIEEISGGRYRIRYTPLRTGVLYRTFITCAPDGVNLAVVTPAEFQDTL